MTGTHKSSAGTFVVATPGRSVCDDNARALEHHGLLRFIALGTRKGINGVPTERTQLMPQLGLAAYAAAKCLSTYRAESFRFRLHPWFDSWVKRRLQPGNHIISSYGYVNKCFEWVRKSGGKTLLDAGNSHPENFWNILSEEYRRWNCPNPPVAKHHYERSLAMMEQVDFVLSPSNFVTRSFLERGFLPSQILRNVYPMDLSRFKPSGKPRPSSRPLTIIAPGALSLRKGTPYLLEAFRLILKSLPDARLRLNRLVRDEVKTIFAQNSDLPILWHPPSSAAQLVEQMHESDLLVLPSLEDGFARTVTEGLSCGLPVITTPNTGASDLIVSGQNGEVVPIRNPAAIANAVLKWADKILSKDEPFPIVFDPDKLSFEKFEAEFIGQLKAKGLIT